MEQPFDINVINTCQLGRDDIPFNKYQLFQVIFENPRLFLKFCNLSSNRFHISSSPVKTYTTVGLLYIQFGPYICRITTFFLALEKYLFTYHNNGAGFKFTNVNADGAFKLEVYLEENLEPIPYIPIIPPRLIYLTCMPPPLPIMPPPLPDVPPRLTYFECMPPPLPSMPPSQSSTFQPDTPAPDTLAPDTPAPDTFQPDTPAPDTFDSSTFHNISTMLEAMAENNQSAERRIERYSEVNRERFN